MRNLLPFGALVIAVAAAGFAVGYFVTSSSAGANSSPSPAVKSLVLRPTPAIPRLSAKIAAWPENLAVVHTVARSTVAPAPVYTAPRVSRPAPAAKPAAPAHQTTTIIFQGGSG